MNQVLDTFDEAIACIDRAESFAFDIETTGLDPLTTDLLVLSLATEEGAWAIPFAGPVPHLRWQDPEMTKRIQHVFSDPEKLAISWNGGFDDKHLMYRGINLKTQDADGMVGIWLLDEMLAKSKKIGLKKQAKILLGVDMDEFEDTNLLDGIVDDKALKYAAEDAKYTYIIWHDYVWPKLQEEGLTKIFTKICMPVLRVLAEMELNGCTLDVAQLKKVEDGLVTQTQEVLVELQEMSGNPKFNPGSSKQLSNLLFGPHSVLKIPVKRGHEWKVKSQQWATDKRTLRRYKNDHPLFAKLTEFRKAKKLLSTYATPLQERALASKDGRVRSSYRQTGTITGRLCVAGDTRLNTSNGTFCISELDLTNTPNIAILTHEGRWQRILGHYYKGREAMYEVTTETGESIKCTGGHRLLTPHGWQHIRDLSAGSEVCTDHDSSRVAEDERAESGKAEDSRRGELSEDRDRVRAVGTRRAISIQGSRTYAPNVALIEEVLSAKVPSSVEGAEVSPVLARDERKHAGGEGTSRGRCSEGPSDEASLSRDVAPRDFEEASDQRVVRASQHRDVRSQKGPSASSSSTGERDGVSTKAGGVFTGHRREGAPLFGRPDGVFQRAVRRVRKCNGANLVHSGSEKLVQVSQGMRQSAEESRVLESQSIRASAIESAVGEGDRASSELPVLQEVSSGFRIPGSKTACRGGRGVSRETPRDRSPRQTKDGCRDSTRVHHFASLYGRRHAATSGCRESHPTSTIKSIVPIGVQDVWDIQVAMDHSYVAHGLIHHNSSSNPNFQNISSKGGIREAFIPAAGMSMIVADYSQLELRMGGCVAYRVFGKSNIVEKYGQGLDLHEATRQTYDALGIDRFNEGTVGHEEARRNAKIANFGYFYGRSADAFAQDNPEVSYEEAATLRELFLVKLYPEITAMHDHCVKDLVENGFVKTITGRRRRFKYCYARDPRDVWWEGWVAWNSIVQGSAQDLIQIAMRDVYADILVGRAGGEVQSEDEVLKLPATTWENVKPLIQVHDELVIEAPKEVENEIAFWLSYRMGKAVTGQPVEFPAEAGIGANWISAKQAPKKKHAADKDDDIRDAAAEEAA